MAVATTSKQAYSSLKKMGEKQRAVHEALGEMGVACNQDIADHLGWTINRVTGRMNELRTMGYVELHGIKVNQFGNNVKTWRVCDPETNKRINDIKEEADAERRTTSSAVSWLYD